MLNFISFSKFVDNIFSSSDVTLGDTFIDRSDGDKKKPFLKGDLTSMTFAFQEAVDKLPEDVSC